MRQLLNALLSRSVRSCLDPENDRARGNKIVLSIELAVDDFGEVLDEYTIAGNRRRFSSRQRLTAPVRVPVADDGRPLPQDHKASPRA